MEIGQGSEAGKQKQVPLWLSQNRERKKKALVGKILTQKNLNYPTVVSMINKAWQVENGLEILDLDRSNLTFLFRFNHNKDFQRVLKCRPWNILGFLLNLQVWEDDMILQDVSFDTAPFWVQFHDLPVDAFDGLNAKTLGDAVGETVMFENLMVDGNMLRTFIRVRSLIRLDEPLQTGFWVPREARDPCWVRIRYERLQNFCYRCGCLVHNGKGCRAEESVVSMKEDKEFGPWLSTLGTRTFEEVVVICKQQWPEARFSAFGDQSITVGGSSQASGVREAEALTSVVKPSPVRGSLPLKALVTGADCNG
ncbi:hypothetical protein QN277_020470 [Acacia crassicarpa]|uniref:DUF4283 domain-containing protein n=1 Tax=Acacia crassicarpa TaxID=499986 RepID=A0AAE1ML26_9FABA|nr:hypothetical protein QN277_020470 [Acacia crassicarpa]